MSNERVTSDFVDGLLKAVRDAVPCDLRGCDTGAPGEFFMLRTLRSGKAVSGLYCPQHEEQFGQENLRKAGIPLDGWAQ